MGPLSSPNNESHSPNKTHRRLENIFLFSNWFTGPKKENWSASWGGDRRRFQKETRTHKLCQPENVAVGPVDNLRLGDRAEVEKLQCQIKHHQNESPIFLPLDTKSENKKKNKKQKFCSFYLHDAVCRVLNEKIQNAVVIEVSWNRLPVRNQRGRCGRIVTFSPWWKCFHNFPLTQGWCTDNDWNSISLLPAEQGTHVTVQSEQAELKSGALQSCQSEPCGVLPVNGSRVKSPFFAYVLLPEHWHFAWGVHQHPVASGGVEAGDRVQAVAKTSHKRKQEFRTLSSSEKKIELSWCSISNFTLFIWRFSNFLWRL